MSDPLSPERLAEIREWADGIAYCIDRFDRNAPEVHRADLLAEVQRLSGELARHTGWEPAVRGAVAELRRQSEALGSYHGVESGTLARAANLVEQALATLDAKVGA